VSMGPIAGRMLLEILECVADIVGIEVLLAAQGLDLRARGMGHDEEGAPMKVDPIELAPGISSLHQRVRALIPFWEDDDVLHPALQAAGALVRDGTLLGKPSPW